MNKTAKLVAAGAAVAAIATLSAPMAANAAPLGGNGNANPSCAAFFAQFSQKYIGVPLGQLKQDAPKGLWAEIAQTHIYDDFGYCGFNN